MIWTVCFTLSLTVLFTSAFYAWNGIRNYNSKKVCTPFNILFVGLFLSVFVVFIPAYAIMLKGESGFLFKVCVFDILGTIQVFMGNASTDLILDNIIVSSNAFHGIISIYMSSLFILAPLMTFGFLTALFKNALAYLFYHLQYYKDIYVFSELNERSLVLAKSIKEHHQNSLMVFTNVDQNESEVSSEDIESAKELNALIFQDDIVTVNFKKHSSKSKIVFFTLAEKEADNLIYALKVLEKYNDRDNTDLYVFSSGAEGELLLANAPKGKIKVRRMNEVRSLIYKFLYDEGYRLFESAVEKEERKEINVIIAGLGKYGTEMLKALTWFCQMDGYSVCLHAFDKDELAEEKFAALCPELMSDKYNGVYHEGESEYTIHIHSGVDVKSRTFAQQIAELNSTSFVFVALGDDAENINQSANIRMLCERAGCKPVIKTVIYNSEEKEALSYITNYRGQPYGVEGIGDFESTYSEEILLGSQLEHLALQRHLKWGQEEEFWQYEYNYRSSMASAVHMKARIWCGIAGADKKEEDLTLEERDIIEHLEHKRWNTYMRSEGYVYSGSPDKSSRNDLAKMHHDLIDFDSLSEEDKRKDSSVGTR